MKSNVISPSPSRQKHYDHYDTKHDRKNIIKLGKKMSNQILHEIEETADYIYTGQQDANQFNDELVINETNSNDDCKQLPNKQLTHCSSSTKKRARKKLSSSSSRSHHRQQKIKSNVISPSPSRQKHHDHYDNKHDRTNIIKSGKKISNQILHEIEETADYIYTGQQDANQFNDLQHELNCAYNQLDAVQKHRSNLIKNVSKSVQNRK